MHTNVSIYKHCGRDTLLKMDVVFLKTEINSGNILSCVLTAILLEKLQYSHKLTALLLLGVPQIRPNSFSPLLPTYLLPT